MSLIDDFKNRFSEFDTGVVDDLLPFLEIEYKIYYNYEYGVSDLDDAIILLLLAHLLQVEIDTNSGNSSPQQIISSTTVGDVSVSYQAQPQSNNANNSFFMSTRYGQKFQQMINNKSAGVFFV